MDEEAQFADFNGELNPLAVALLLLGILILLASSRKNGLKALLGVAVMVPLGQRFVVLGLHFMFFRILIAVGLMRVFLHREHSGFVINIVDKLMLVWGVIELICGGIRGMQGQYVGFVYDALGVYFVVRMLTKEPEDVLGPLRFLALLSLIVATVMCFEAVTHRNPFSVMGGVPLVDSIRNGKARAQGPFQHPIAAGAFGAALFPLMYGLWRQGGSSKRAGIAGLVGSLVIVFTSVSSGAILTLMAAVIGLFLWRERDRMRRFRYAVLATLIALNMVMKVPVWWLIARVSELVGGSGWYRSWLIDLTIRHFSSWWLVGDSFTLNWAPEAGATIGDPNNLDLTNYYVVQSAMGGIWMLAVFIAIIACCFKIVGGLVRSHQHLVWERSFIWTFGVAIAAYCTSFISGAVAGSSGVFWHWQLAVVAGLPAYVTATGEAAVSDVELVDSETEPLYSPHSS